MSKGLLQELEDYDNACFLVAFGVSLALTIYFSFVL